MGKGTKTVCHDVGKVILEIDPIIDEISQKRWSFYQHCGFQQNEYIHAHQVITQKISRMSLGC